MQIFTLPLLNQVQLLENWINEPKFLKLRAQQALGPQLLGKRQSRDAEDYDDSANEDNMEKGGKKQ
eukprot:403362346